MMEEMMSRKLAVLVCVVVIAGNAIAQFKSQADQESRVSDGLMHQSAPQLLLGWFNPDKFHMQHSVDLSFASMGDRSVSLGTYTNSMSYEFADNLVARTDLSMSYSPYNNLPTLNGKKNDLSSVYLSRAQLDYKPWENVHVQLQYRTLPYGSYYGSSFYNPWFRESGF